MILAVLREVFRRTPFDYVLKTCLGHFRCRAPGPPNGIPPRLSPRMLTERASPPPPRSSAALASIWTPIEVDHGTPGLGIFFRAIEGLYQRWQVCFKIRESL